MYSMKKSPAVTVGMPVTISITAGMTHIASTESDGHAEGAALRVRDAFVAGGELMDFHSAARISAAFCSHSAILTVSPSRIARILARAQLRYLPADR